MMQHGKGFHVIKDPVHGTMQFTTEENAWIKPVMTHPVFQRLRHIKQLGLADLIFPGAVHTRFNHSLGCCYVASQIANKIDLDTQEKQLVILAGLLHDIGHGPFSHAFENVFVDKAIRHEDWTPNFLRAFDDVLSTQQMTTIKAMIMHKAQPGHVLSDIVSSQLDADRLDYLLRDSHFCGVTYGTYDLRWMLHSLTRITEEGRERLGIIDKGVGVAEHYLNARRLMMRNIYHHPKKLAIEYLLIQLLKIISENLLDEPAFQPIKVTRLGQFLTQVGLFNRAIKRDVPQFIKEAFPLYQTLCDYDVYALMRDLVELPLHHDAIILAKRIYLREFPSIYPVKLAQFSAIAQAIAALKKPNWQLFLLGEPYQSYVGDTDPIYVDNKGSVQRLDRVSMLVNAFSSADEQMCFLCVDSSVQNERAVQAIVDVI